MLFSVLTPPHQPPWALALLPIPGPACPPQPWAHRAALLLCHSRPCCLDLGMIQIQIQPLPAALGKAHGLCARMGVLGLLLSTVLGH